MTKSKIPKSNLELRTLEECIEVYLREVFEDSIHKLSRITEVGILTVGKRGLPLRYAIAGQLFRFLYGLRFKGFEQTVFLLLDIVDMRTVGIQAGVILESTVPRGALILPEQIYPLELAKEEKRNHVNPFYSFLVREKENSKASSFFQSFNLSTDMVEYKKASLTPTIISPVSTSPPISETVKVLYPKYLAIYPNESKTIVTLSISTPSHKKLEKYYRDKKGKFHLVKFRLPKDKVLKTLLPLMMEAEKRVTYNKCDYAVQSKKPEIIPLFEYLVNVASNEDMINNRELIRKVFAETLDVLVRKSGKHRFEVTLIPSVRKSFTSRDRPTTVQCPECNASYNYSYDTISYEGIVKCRNCLNEFQGIPVGPNY